MSNSAKIQDGQLLRMHYDMLRIRMVEEAIAERYAEQEMRCPVHLSIGQEAPPLERAMHCSTRIGCSVLIVAMLIILQWMVISMQCWQKSTVRRLAA